MNNTRKNIERRRRLEADIIFYGLCLSLVILAVLIVWWILTTAEGRYASIGAVGLAALYWVEYEKNK